MKKFFLQQATCFLVFLIAIASNAFAAPTNLTSGYWDVRGTDVWNNGWNNSKLYFESQTLNGDTYDLTGYFWWENNTSTRYGKEAFIGTLFSDLTFSLDGYLVGDTVGIGAAHYSGVISEDGSQITNGIWRGPGVADGQWTASHVVPIPTTIWLFGFGIVGLRMLRRTKKK